MGNLRPLKLFNAALLKPLKYRHFIEKSTKSVVKVYILVLDMTIFPKIGPRADLGGPWLPYPIQNNYLKFPQRTLLM
jgi:hypothetical protein